MQLSIQFLSMYPNDIRNESIYKLRQTKNLQILMKPYI